MDESLPCSGFLGQVCMMGPWALGLCQVAAGRESPQPGFSSPRSGPLAATIVTRGSTPALLTRGLVVVHLRRPVCCLSRFNGRQFLSPSADHCSNAVLYVVFFSLHSAKCRLSWKSDNLNCNSTYKKGMFTLFADWHSILIKKSTNQKGITSGKQTHVKQRRDD